MIEYKEANAVWDWISVQFPTAIVIERNTESIGSLQLVLDLNSSAGYESLIITHGWAFAVALQIMSANFAEFRIVDMIQDAKVSLSKKFEYNLTTHSDMMKQLAGLSPGEQLLAFKNQ